MKMTDHKIDQKLLQQAIKVLRDVNTKFYEDASKKKPLLEDEKELTIYVQLSLKKIPKTKSIKLIKINLPHSLVKDNSEVCLITGDLDKKNHKAEIEPDVLHYKDLLKKHSIDNISEVVTLRQLRTEYKPYEAKQKLLAAYDVFLADRKIAECLPRVLGRHFYKKRKFPIQITLDTPNLKQQVEKALSTKVFYLTGHGNSCNSEVAYLDMTDKDISENVIEMVKAFCDKLPGSWDNVMGIYLKTSLSKAVPVYMSYDDPNKVHLEEEKNDNSYEIDELSTCPDRLVKVYKDGSVRTVRVKRMAEAERFETTNGGENSDMEEQKTENIDDCLNLGNADLNGETGNVTKNKKKKKENHTHNSLQNTDMKEESPKIKKKSKNKKSKDIILEEETNQLLCTMEEKEESLKIKKKSKNKKSKDILEEETNQSLCTMEEKEESPKIKKKSKNKKSKDMILEETNQSLCTMEEKEESSEIQSHKKSKNKRKSIGRVLDNEVCDNTASSELKGKSGDLNKKPKSSRKSMGNILRKDDESLISSQLKNKQKKRKSIL